MDRSAPNPASISTRGPSPAWPAAWSVQDAPEQRPPRLLDQLRQAVRRRRYSPRTEEAYVYWARCFIVFHHKRHPTEMGQAEVVAFLSWLAVQRKVSASTQNQALSAILFLYRNVLDREIGWLEGIVRARQPHRLPVVLGRDEVRAVLAQLEGAPRLMAALLYGAGLRLLECASLRVKDVDFAANQIVVRAGKGGRDRRTMLPSSVRRTSLVIEPLRSGSAPPPLGTGAPATRGRPRPRCRLGRSTHGARAQVPARRPRVGLAVGLPRDPPLSGPVHRRGPQTPPPRVGPPACDADRSTQGRHHQTRELPHVPPFVRHAPLGGWLRHPHGSGAARPPGTEHDHGLHARPQPWRSRRPQPSGPPVIPATQPISAPSQPISAPDAPFGGNWVEGGRLSDAAD